MILYTRIGWQLKGHFMRFIIFFLFYSFYHRNGRIVKVFKNKKDICTHLDENRNKRMPRNNFGKGNKNKVWKKFVVFYDYCLLVCEI